MKIKGKWAFVGLIAMVIFVLAGCQVDGVDLAKVLVPDPEITSSEGALTLNLELTANPAVPAAAGQPDIAGLGKMTVKLTGIKQQDKEHSSADGVISYAKGDIAFHLYSDKDQVVLSVDGASKPIVLGSQTLLQSGSMSGTDTGAGDSANPLSNPLVAGIIGKTSAADRQELVNKIIPFVLGNFPNPAKLNVESVTDSINNESMSLKKIHAEIKGSEIPSLLKQFLKNIAADEKGLTELVKAVMKASGQDGAGGGAFDLSSFAVTFVQQAAEQYAAELDKSIGTGYFTDESSLKTDFYVDGNLHLRKIGFDLNLTDTKSATSPFSVVKISGSYETWNQGKPVTAVKIDSQGAFDMTQPSATAHFVKSLDPNSKLYGLLTKDLKVTAKHIAMTVRGTDPDPVFAAPFIRSGNTLVPVRFVTERLDADVQWNGDTQEVTVKDLWSGQKIVFKIGSKTVTVDGVASELEVPVELNYNVTYVPLRFISEKFGAKVDWKDGVVSIDRP